MSIIGLPAMPSTHFDSPDDHTATEPPERRGLRRDGVRLLVADRARITHARFDQLGDHLRAGHVLVINTSATLPGQLDAVRAGRRVVVHLANRLADGSRVVELRSAPDAGRPVLDGRPDEQIELPGGGALTLVEPYPAPDSSPSGSGNRLWRGAVSVPGRLLPYLERHARPISYGYLRDRFPLEAYQTIFAVHPGSAEMPSAGRPFTPRVLARLGPGIGVAALVLHTGVSSLERGERPYPERFEVPATTAARVNATRAAGGRVIAVGTTVTRALETAAAADGTVSAAAGWTSLTITPERGVRVVDGLITGWHEPDASHLLLLEAVAGRETVERSYASAVQAGYRWHEFGDSHLLLRDR
jgi:S-adenosylmethionine:tRNA ribosyltransferase-isomerase